MRKQNGTNLSAYPSVSWIRVVVFGSIVIAFYILFKGLSNPNFDMVTLPIELIMKGDPIELQQHDVLIRNFIWKRGYLRAPSAEPYNLEKPDFDPSMGQGQLVRNILQNMRNGFFVECGALDGETRSNSLYFEKELGWKGLLIEGDPKNYQLVVKKNRKAWTSNTCLATKPYPHEVIFQQQFNIGKISAASSKTYKNETNYARVQCFPIFSLLSALDVYTVDYFSLDVEGNELDVLVNIPFDLVFIKVLSVEFSHVSKGKNVVKEFMESKGYVVAGEVTNSQGLANDFIFVHKSLKHLIPLSG